MIDPVSINDPVLGFRLDPGEPGMLRRARASDATLRVTAQEQRNLSRLKNEAFREGRIPIQAGAVFTRSLPGTGVGTVVAGQTTVVSVPDSTPPASGVRIPGEERVRSLLEDVLARAPDAAAGQALISLEPEEPADLPEPAPVPGEAPAASIPAAGSEEQPAAGQVNEAEASDQGDSLSAARVGAQAFERNQLTFLRSRLEEQASPTADPQAAGRPPALDLIA